MLTEQEYYITERVYKMAKIAQEVRDFDKMILSNLYQNPENNPDMYWVLLTFQEEQYETVQFMVSFGDRTDDFILNLYYHLLHLTQEYELTGLHRPNAMELAQRDIEELLASYNQKEVDFHEIKKISPELFPDDDDYND